MIAFTFPRPFDNERKQRQRHSPPRLAPAPLPLHHHQSFRLDQSLIAPLVQTRRQQSRRVCLCQTSPRIILPRTTTNPIARITTSPRRRQRRRHRRRGDRVSTNRIRATALSLPTPKPKRVVVDTHLPMMAFASNHWKRIRANVPVVVFMTMVFASFKRNVTDERDS